MAHTVAAAATAAARWRRDAEAFSSSIHTSAGMTNDRAVMRVRQAAAVISPTSAPLTSDGSRRHLTNAHAENVTVAMNTSSRQPSTDQEIRSYSIATSNANAIPAILERSAVPRR
jgi:hypothetical protein